MSHRPPLVDDPSASPRARAALAAGRADLPAEARMDAIAARVASLVGPTPPSGGSGAPPPADPSPPLAPASPASLAGTPITAKVIGIVALAAAGAGLFWAAGDPARSPAPDASLQPLLASSADAPARPIGSTAAEEAQPPGGADRATQAEPPAPPAPSGEPLAVAPAVAAPQPPSAAARSTRTSPSASAAPAATTTAPSSASAAPSSTPAANEGEAAMLSRAQGLLARDPAAALAVTEAHAKGFPAAALVEEREVIAVDALVRLGRRDAARARVAAVRARFPRSAYLPRLDALVAEP